MGLSAVCDYGISWSYSLTIFETRSNGNIECIMLHLISIPVGNGQIRQSLARLFCMKLLTTYMSFDNTVQFYLVQYFADIFKELMHCFSSKSKQGRPTNVVTDRSPTNDTMRKRHQITDKYQQVYMYNKRTYPSSLAQRDHAWYMCLS